MLQPDTNHPFGKFHFTEEELMRGKMLSVETMAYYKHAATEIAEAMLTTKFSPNPEVREAQINEFVFRQAQYEFLLTALSDSGDVYTALKASESSDKQE